MTIEEAFKLKFEEIFPNINIYPLVAPQTENGLYAIFKTINRQIEVDLKGDIHQNSVNIQLYITSSVYKDVANTIWTFISNINNALGIYAESCPEVQQIITLGSSDNYDFELQVYQSVVEIQIFFKE